MSVMLKELDDGFGMTHETLAGSRGEAFEQCADLIFGGFVDFFELSTSPGAKCDEQVATVGSTWLALDEFPPLKGVKGAAEVSLVQLQDAEQIAGGAGLVLMQLKQHPCFGEGK